jgi:hypothetical protein
VGDEGPLSYQLVRFDDEAANVPARDGDDDVADDGRNDGRNKPSPAENKGLAGGPPEALAAARQTATNPAVVDAFTLVIIADGEGPAYPGLARPALDLAAAHEDAPDIDLAAAELRKIVPNAGSYVSESNYFNRSWQNAYWGENYSRLRAIKRKYDPDGLFFVHHGVGSEDWSADGFTRLA